MELKLSQNLDSLIWPLSEDERQTLEQNILRSGCANPFHVWRDILLDGFPHYQICQEHSIPLQAHELHFKNWEETIIWVCKDQLCRSNLPAEMRKYLIGRRYAAEKILAARNFVRRNQYSLPTAERKLRNHADHDQHRTALPLAQEYHVCCTTIQKYGVFAVAIDRIASVDHSMRMQILSGKIWIAHDNIVALASMNEMQIKLIIAYLYETNKTHLQVEDLTRIVGYITTAKKRPGRSCTQSSVKDMPAYDPDTAVLGLALTIPSWCSSVRRVYNATDLTAISESARDRLCAGLRVLQEEIEFVKQAIKEAKAL